MERSNESCCPKGMDQLLPASEGETLTMRAFAGKGCKNGLAAVCSTNRLLLAKMIDYADTPARQPCNVTYGSNSPVL